MDRAEIECRLTNQSLAPIHTFFVTYCLDYILRFGIFSITCRDF